MTVSLFAGVWVLPAFHTVVALLLFWSSMHIMKRSFVWLLPKTTQARFNRKEGALEAE
jgi:divalent metal cation (Fe/Co/Zn/Cd) transporter